MTSALHQPGLREALGPGAGIETVRYPGAICPVAHSINTQRKEEVCVSQC